MIKNNNKFIIKLILVFLWTLVIFFFSNSNSNETTNQSQSVTKTIITYSIKISNAIHITNIDMNEENINNIINNFHPIIRKCAHISEYFILAILVLIMIKDTKLNYFYTFTILFCIFIALLDESHQLFVDGRSGSIIDVLIDTSGSLLYLLINRGYHLINKK